MITLTIDGRQVTVPKGTVVVDAARQVGIEIPVFCHHPKLKPVGMCRMCLVEVGTPLRDRATGEIQRDEEGNPVIRWFPNLQTGCTTVVSDGMVVHTQTERVEDARRSIIEFLLTSHPLDCPVCDKGGECPLQNQTMLYGLGESRFIYDDKFHFTKPVELGPFIFLDRERCIQCARCTRFCDEIAGDHVLGLESRGRSMHIITYSDPPFDSKFSGNTTDICPVGALTTRDFRFQARAWELTDVPSLCPHCSVGCSVVLGTRYGEIKRVMPRRNDAVNEIWICDKGRFGHHFVGSEERLETPLVRRDGELVPASWDEALDLIAKRFGQIKVEEGPEALGGLAGDRCANEDLYLFQKLLRQAIGTGNVDHRPRWLDGDQAQRLIAALGVGQGTDFGAMDAGCAILVLGADVEEEQPVHFLRVKQAAERGAHLIVANGRPTKLDRSADQVLRFRYGSQAHLVWGLVQVVLAEDLEELRCVERGSGLDEVREKLKAYDLAGVSQVTGVPEEAIEGAARAFAQAENGVILFGREAMLGDSGSLTQALAALALVTGHVGRANNGLLALLPHNNSQGALDMGVLPDRLPGYAPVSETRGLDSNGMIEAAAAGKLKALYVMSTDPAADDPAAREALRDLDFLVVQELFLTETAQLADVVLPAASFAERDGTFTNAERRVQFFYRAVPSPGESRPDWAIVADLGRRLAGQGWDYRSAGEIMAEIARVVPMYAGLSHDLLRPRLPGAVRPDYRDIPYRGTAFHCLGGEGVQWATQAQDDDARFALSWVQPPVLPEPDATFSFMLVAPRVLYDQGTLIQKSEVLHPLLPEAYVELSQADAERLGVEQGDRVMVASDRGEIELTLRIGRHSTAGVAMAPVNLDGTMLSRLFDGSSVVALVRIAKRGD